MAIILCIDDDVVGLQARRLVLEAEGYEVIVANSGEEGLAVIRSGRPIDIVILDYFMPDMSGIETARQIAVLNPVIPIIMLSGFIELPDESLGIVDRWIRKRSPEELLQAVQHILSRCGNRQKFV